MKKVPDLTAEAINAGVTKVEGVTLRTSKLREHRDEARLMAIRAAKEKATAMAAELGAKLKKPYSITEGSLPEIFSSSGYNVRTSSNSVSNNFTPAPPEAEVGSGAYAPGTIILSASVTVSFVLE